MVIIFCLLAVTLNAFKEFKNIRIKELTKHVDITSRYVQSTTDINILNEGIVPLNKFYHSVHNSISNKLYQISLTQGDITIVPKIIEQNDTKSNSTIYEFQIPQPIEGSSQLKLVEYYYDRYQLLPKKIKITEDQTVLFEDSLLFYSPYTVLSQTVTYSHNRLISYSFKKNVEERDESLHYGPFDSRRPFQYLMTTIHSENNSPLVVFRDVERVIEVSHWGNIAISEKYKLINNGAELIGEYSRVSYNKYNPSAGKNALKELEALLPFQTWGIYYRDEIGNISTSNAIRGMINDEKAVHLQLRPRFGILGGWKSNWELGYNLPTKEYLEQVENQQDVHILTQNFGFVVDDVIAENYSLKLILPEGANEILWKAECQVDEPEHSLTYSYFDTFGRPTLVFKKRLMSQFDNVEMKVQYRFQRSQLLRELMMIFIVVLMFFLCLVLFGRAELVTFKLKSD